MVKVLDIAENFVSLQRVILVDIAITSDTSALLRSKMRTIKLTEKWSNIREKNLNQAFACGPKNVTMPNAFCDTTVNPVGGKFFQHDHQTKLLTTEAHKKRTLTK